MARRHAAGAGGLQFHPGAAPRLPHRRAARPARWREMLNTDAAIYGGSNMGNGGGSRPSPSRRTASPLRWCSPCRRSPPSCCAAGNALMRRCRQIGCCRAARIRSAPPRTGSASTSRCSRRMPSRIELCLFDPSGRREVARLPLPECTDEVWHGYLPDAPPGQLYGYRAHGPYEPRTRPSLQPQQAAARSLCARTLPARCAGPMRCTAIASAPPRADLTFDRRDSASAMPKAVVADRSVSTGASDRRRARPGRDTVIYEAHLRGLTMRRGDMPAARARHLRRPGQPAA